jgi:chromosome segregation ATPase
MGLWNSKVSSEIANLQDDIKLKKAAYAAKIKLLDDELVAVRLERDETRKKRDEFEEELKVQNAKRDEMIAKLTAEQQGMMERMDVLIKTLHNQCKLLEERLDAANAHNAELTKKIDELLEQIEKERRQHRQEMDELLQQHREEREEDRRRMDEVKQEQRDEREEQNRRLEDLLEQNGQLVQMLLNDRATETARLPYPGGYPYPSLPAQKAYRK